MTIPFKDRFTFEDLEAVVELSVSVSETVGRLNIRAGSDSHQKVKSLIEHWSIDTSHFGTKRRRRKLTENDVFRKFPRCHLSTVKTWAKKRLPQVCAPCGLLPEWCHKFLTLQLNHIDGDTTNCELSNLEMICPNWHTQTDTYGGRNNGKSKVIIEIDMSGEKVKNRREPNHEVLRRYFA